MQWGIQRRARAPPMNQNFLNCMQFLGKFVYWRLPMEGWRPLLHGILDAPWFALFQSELKFTTPSRPTFVVNPLEQNHISTSTLEFSLNVFTEFSESSDKKMYHLKGLNLPSSHLLCNKSQHHPLTSNFSFTNIIC